MTKRVDSSWYKRPERIKVSESAGGIVTRKEANILYIAFVREGDYMEYILPKGTRKKGEPFEETARREIREEAGFKQLVLLGLLEKNERFNFMRTKWKSITYYLFYTDEVYPKPQDDKREYHCEWFPLDDLPTMFWPDQEKMLRDHQVEIKARVSKFLSQRNSPSNPEINPH